jgi:hypothetical protein
MIIKIILIATSLALAALMLRGRARATHQAALRVAGLILVVLAITAVMFPGITVWAANLVGVRRGTDLVLYLTVMTFWFVTVASFQRFHAMSEQIVRLSRELALLDARLPQAHSEHQASLPAHGASSATTRDHQ